jgi:hypothetical protein
MILVLRDRLFRKKVSPNAVAHKLHKRKMRLENPDFAGMERMLGTPIPKEVIDLYKSKLVLETDIEISSPNDPENSWLLSSFIPAHPAEYDQIWEEAKEKFCFATSPFGDPYYIDINGPNLPVFIYYHDGNDHEKIVDSLAEFLSWMRSNAAS